jgi:NAD(P)H-hydrate epimerase
MSMLGGVASCQLPVVSCQLSGLREQVGSIILLNGGFDVVRLTRQQVREVDRRAIEDYGIPGIVLMENAARAVVDVAMEMLRGVANPYVMIVCGGGNNGGDGLAVARHLHNRGVFVEIAWAANSLDYKGDAAINHRIVAAMKLPDVPIEDADIPLAGGVVDLTIDALYGTGLTSAVRDDFPIRLINEFPVPVLSIDLPSGMDCDTGQPLGACVKATRTVTFVAEKAGFANPAAKQFTGEVTVGDIGCPKELVEAVAKEV